jgi:hypothetical protein
MSVEDAQIIEQVGAGLCFLSVELRLYTACRKAPIPPRNGNILGRFGGVLTVFVDAESPDKWGQASASRRSNRDSTCCIETFGYLLGMETSSVDSVEF